MSRQHLHHLMSEIGPLLGLAEVIEYPDQALWVLVHDADHVLEAELDEGRGRLMLSMELGPAPDDEALYRTLLQYNYLWRRSGGVRMALAGDTLVQMLELPADGLDTPNLVQVVDNLRDGAALWRALLVPAAQAVPSGQVAPPDGHMLRA